MEIRIDNIETISEAAKEFVANIGESTVCAFYGKMGAGKTTFVKAVCEELGVEKAQVYRRRDSALRHFTLCLYGQTES